MTLPIHRTTLARPQSLRPCGAPPFTQGRLYGAMQASPPTRNRAGASPLKGSLYTPRAILRLSQPFVRTVGADSISARGIARRCGIARANAVRPYAPFAIGTVGMGLDPSLQIFQKTPPADYSSQQRVFSIIKSSFGSFLSRKEQNPRKI